ncbi:hypothetical protein NQK81_01090 [Amycolatopsis roodepoortensis]|uniref:hypothetical protein n=1 Tax=Amycolatopsis roodepoortensis TaxID=700274 RepID=UPI00214AE25D|nr:hypothetical protein [Amycolatopsis roodepoortensis]UUV32069.1 hypothetical protein NQK81_01090 [Amycolatopsis roodepoortensis]
MSYPFITLEIEIVLGLVVTAAGLVLQEIDERREHRRGHVSPLQRQLRPRTALRDLGLTLSAGGAVLALPGLGAIVWGLSMTVGINDLEPSHAPPFVIAPRDLLPHVTFGVLVVFVLSVLACVVRMARRRSGGAPRDRARSKPPDVAPW